MHFCRGGGASLWTVTGISLPLSISMWVLLNPPIERPETDQRLNAPVHGQCGERRLPKVQPSTRPGIEPWTFWLAVGDLTSCANLAHTNYRWAWVKS